MSPDQLNILIKRLAREAGFDRCGVARAEPIGRSGYVRDWLGRGMAGSMEYLGRNIGSRIDAREHLPGARSAVVVALSYKQPVPSTPDDEARGRVAMYAWGEDYHTVLRDKLRDLERRLRAGLSEPFECRICVDTAPIIERELAAGAGIGWIAKNTLVIDPELGSFIFLGVMLTTLDITPDLPIEDHCGTCTACLDTCPTKAFTAPYQMDASRCISYFTIEHRGDISKTFQEMMGDWVFGCDVCQEVCPHNRKAPDTREARFAPRESSSSLSLNELINASDEELRGRFTGSAMERAKPAMWRRNAEIAANNRKS